jgi:hypothetical protein
LSIDPAAERRSATSMPKRTNDFQRLIGVIQSHLDPGATVEEPAFLIDRVTKAEREVDIVIRGSVAQHPVVISVECRDRRRTDHVGWVEEMHGKHLPLPTNVLILASHSGFSDEAIKVAEVYGIRCFILDDVDPSSPDRLFPDTQSLWGKTWTVTIDRVEITVEASDGLPRETLNAYLGMGLFLGDRSPVASVGQIAEAFSRNPSVIERTAAEVKPEHTFLMFGWSGPLFGQRFYIEKREPLVLRPIERFNVIAKIAVTIHEFPLQYGLYGTVRVAWAKGDLLGKPMMIVATKDSTGQTRLTMKEFDVQGAPPLTPVASPGADEAPGAASSFDESVR